MSKYISIKQMFECLLNMNIHYDTHMIITIIHIRTKTSSRFLSVSLNKVNLPRFVIHWCITQVAVRFQAHVFIAIIV